jgi:hypothetical protein
MKTNDGVYFHYDAETGSMGFSWQDGRKFPVLKVAQGFLG